MPVLNVLKKKENTIDWPFKMLLFVTSHQKCNKRRIVFLLPQISRSTQRKGKIFLLV